MARETETPIVVPGLRWAIKRSLLEYVARMPGGLLAVGAGAATAPDGEVLFPPEEGGAPYAFSGEVRLAGHGGLLDIRFGAPRLAIAGDRGELTAQIGAVPSDRLTLMTFEVAARRRADDVEVVAATDVLLAVDAVDLFGGVYPPGEPFEPLLAAVAV